MPLAEGGQCPPLQDQAQGWQLVFRFADSGSLTVASAQGAALVPDSGRGSPYRLVNSFANPSIQSGGVTQAGLSIEVGPASAAAPTDSDTLDLVGVFFNGFACNKIPSSSFLLTDCNTVPMSNATGPGLEPPSALCVSVFCCDDASSQDAQASEYSGTSNSSQANGDSAAWGQLLGLSSSLPPQVQQALIRLAEGVLGAGRGPSGGNVSNNSRAGGGDASSGTAVSMTLPGSPLGLLPPPLIPLASDSGGDQNAFTDSSLSSSGGSSGGGSGGGARVPSLAITVPSVVVGVLALTALGFWAYRALKRQHPSHWPFVIGGAALMTPEDAHGGEAGARTLSANEQLHPLHAAGGRVEDLPVVWTLPHPAPDKPLPQHASSGTLLSARASIMQQLASSSSYDASSREMALSASSTAPREEGRMRSSFGVLGVAGRVSSFVQPIPEGQGSSRRNLFGVNLPRTASSPTPMHVEGRDGAFARLGRRYSFQQGIGPPTTLGATHHGILLGGSTSVPEGVAAAAVASAVAPLPTTTAAAAGPSSSLLMGSSFGGISELLPDLQPARDLVIGGKLGSGAFGTVCQLGGARRG